MNDTVLSGCPADRQTLRLGGGAARRVVPGPGRRGHRVIGYNGAGKSTLVKCLCGAEQPWTGRILLAGNEVHLDSPTTARRLGIETVYQDLAVAPELDSAVNLFLDRKIYRRGILGMLDKAEMRRRAVEEFKRLGVTLQRTDVPRRASPTPA